jgi:hypothetical protein
VDFGSGVFAWVHGDCHPLAGHLEKSLALLWVGGQVRELDALARKVFHFTVGCHDAPPAPIGKAARLVVPGTQARCERRVCPVGDSIEDYQRPFCRHPSLPTYQHDFTPGENCLPPPRRNWPRPSASRMHWGGGSRPLSALARLHIRDARTVRDYERASALFASGFVCVAVQRCPSRRNHRSDRSGGMIAAAMASPAVFKSFVGAVTGCSRETVNKDLRHQ